VPCCLFSASLDTVTRTMHVTWEGSGAGGSDPVLASSSQDGRLWTSPVPVTHGDVRAAQRVNSDVVARGG